MNSRMVWFSIAGLVIVTTAALFIFNVREGSLEQSAPAKEQPFSHTRKNPAVPRHAMTATPEAALRGIVIEQGADRPVSGVHLRLTSSNGTRSLSVRTNARGQFFVPNLAAGSYEVSLSTDTFRIVGGSRSVYIRNDTPSHLRILVQQLFRVSGIVVMRGSERPVARLALELETDAVSETLQAITENDGTFLFEERVPAGKLTFLTDASFVGLTDAPERSSLRLQTLVVLDEDPDVRIEFPWAGHIAVEVIDAWGAPLAGAVVCCVRETHLPSAVPSQLLSSIQSLRGVRTDAQGFAILAPVPTEQALVVFASHADHAPKHARVVNAATNPSVTLQLAGYGSIEGWVLDDLGNGVAEATVNASRVETSNFLEASVTAPSAVLSDPNGRFCFGRINPGSYTVDATIAHPGKPRLEGTAPVDVSSGGQAIVELHLERPSGRIEGIVVDTKNLPIEGMKVSAALATGGGRGGMGITNALGEFSVLVPTREPYRVFPFRSAQQRGDAITVVPDAFDVRLEWKEHTGALIVRVLDEAGNAMADADVEASLDFSEDGLSPIEILRRQRTYLGVTGHDGQVRFARMEPGSYVVTSVARSWAFARNMVEIASTDGLVTLQLTPGRAVTGRAEDSQGRAVGGVSVVVTTGHSIFNSTLVQASSSGEFLLHVAPGMPMDGLYVGVLDANGAVYFPQPIQWSSDNVIQAPPRER